MNDVAERHKFFVVYPEQTTAANPLGCWNWFDPRHQEREGGEPSSLASIVEQVRSHHNIDPKRVYVVGLSAGGAMAVVMGATYPDLFSGIGVSAGLEFKAAKSVETGLAAMKQGGPDPKQQALLAFKAMSKHLPDVVKPGRGAKHRMPVIVFQGDSDPYVNPINAEQLIVQWAQTNDYLDGGKHNNGVAAEPATRTEGAVPEGHQFTRSVYRDRAGRLLLEKWIVKGLSHAWSGSQTASAFADPKGPNASEEMWRFFRETTLATRVGNAGNRKLKTTKRVEGIQ